jgi:hypothetical protein
MTSDPINLIAAEFVSDSWLRAPGPTRSVWCAISSEERREIAEVMA